MGKRILARVVFFVTAIVLVVGCSKESNHMVRVKNSFYEDMRVVKIDAINYGEVKKKAVTEYKSVAAGDFNISGSSSSGLPLTGSGTVKGKGTHHWTLTITSSGAVSFNEDK